MLKTIATTALVIFHLVIFAIAARKAPRVVRAARRSRLIAGLAALALLALAMVLLSRFALHSRPLTLVSAVVTMVSFILTFRLSTRGRIAERVLAELGDGEAVGVGSGDTGESQ